MPLHQCQQHKWKSSLYNAIQCYKNTVIQRCSVIIHSIFSMYIPPACFQLKTKGLLNHDAEFLGVTHLVADAEGHLWNLDVDEGVVHGGSLLHLVDVVHGMLEEAGGRMSFPTVSLSVMLCERRPRAITSGTFLNDLLTPALRFSPWVTPLLGPMAPMVSSDDCRGLTGIPETPPQRLCELGGLWATRRPPPHTPPESNSHSLFHTQLKVISKVRESLNSSLDGITK